MPDVPEYQNDCHFELVKESTSHSSEDMLSRFLARFAYSE
jgi:hypothetical protein